MDLETRHQLQRINFALNVYSYEASDRRDVMSLCESDLDQLKFYLAIADEIELVVKLLQERDNLTQRSAARLACKSAKTLDIYTLIATARYYRDELASQR